jgi:hypothetical protein
MKYIDKQRSRDLKGRVGESENSNIDKKKGNKTKAIRDTSG